MSQLTEILVGLLLACVLVVGGAFGGYHYRGEMAAIAQGKIQHQLDVADQHSAILQEQLDTQLAEHQLTYITLKSEIAPNVNLVVEAPGQPAKARPAYFLTGFDVCVWNDSLLGAGAASRGLGSAACASSPQAYILTTAAFSDALTNVVNNYRQYADCRSVVASWQKWYHDIPSKNKAAP
jgi:hypothetical protein